MTIPSVHGNLAYAYPVLAERGRIILHTEFNEASPAEYTDVLFDGVVARHFECSLRGNILFAIEEADLKAVLADYAPLFQRLKSYGWPLFEPPDSKDLEEKLRERGTHAFMLHSSLGLSGFVFATTVKYSQRESKKLFDQ